MKKSFLHLSSIFWLVLILIVQGCDPEEVKKNAESNDAKDEAEMDAYYQDLDDMTSVTVSATGGAYAGGRQASTISVDDSRFTCATATLTLLSGSTADYPMGQIVVDFGSGCKDSKGITRKGKVIFTYQGPRNVEGTTVVTTTDNYYINGIKLDGTRTTTIIHVTSDNDIEYNVTLTGGKATYDDQTFATRESDLYIRVIKDANPLNDKLIVNVDSEASGMTRREKTYAVTLSKPLEYHRFCTLAVSGVKNILVGGVASEIVIDYGDGTCDGSATVTFLGKTQTISIGS